MRSIFTYPNNLSTDFVDPRYIGDATTGWKKRVNQLLSGTYLSWPALDPVADLGTTSNQAIQMQSRFINYLDDYKIGGNDYNLSMYDLHSLPIAIGKMKLLDSEEVSSAVLTGPNNHVEITFTNAHTFQNDDTVTIDDFDGTIGQEPPLNFDVEVVDSDTIKLKDGSGNYFRYYILEYADISTGGAAAAAPTVFTVTSHTLTDGTLVQMTNFDGTLAELNNEEFYVQNTTSTTFNLSYDEAGTDLLAFEPQQQLAAFNYQFLADGKLTVELSDPNLFDRTQVIFNRPLTERNDWYSVQESLYQYQQEQMLSSDVNISSISQSSALFPNNVALFFGYLLLAIAGGSTTPAGAFFLKKTATSGVYELHTDASMTNPFNWKTTNFLQKNGEYVDGPDSVRFLSQSPGGSRMKLWGAAYENPLRNVVNTSNMVIHDMNVALPVPPSFSYPIYTDNNGYIYEDAGLTTELDFSSWEVLIPYHWWKDNDTTAVGNVSHASKPFSDNGIEIDTTKQLTLNTNNVNDTSFISDARNGYMLSSGIRNASGQLIDNDYRATLDYTGRAFDGYQLWEAEDFPYPNNTDYPLLRERQTTDINSISYGQFYRITEPLFGYNTNQLGSWKESHIPQTDADLGQSAYPNELLGNIIRIPQYNLNDPGGSTVVNPLFTLINGANTGTYPTSTSYILGNGDERIVITPIYKSPAVTGSGAIADCGEFWECYANYINEFGTLTAPLKYTDTFLDTSNNGAGGRLGGCALFNPIWNNGTVDAEINVGLFQRTIGHAGLYAKNWITMREEYRPGTIFLADTNGFDPASYYIWFPVWTGQVGASSVQFPAGTDQQGMLFPYDNGVIKPDTQTTWTKPFGSDLCFGDTDQLTYFNLVSQSTGYNSISTASAKDYYYYRYQYNPAGGVQGEAADLLQINHDYAGTDIDTVDLALVDSTIGEVTEVHEVEDSSQKVKTSFTDSTIGFVAISTNDPLRYELREVDLIMPGTQVYSYKDASNVTQYGARVNPDFYYLSGEEAKTYLSERSEEYPDITVGVDGSGNLNGTFTMSLKSGETTFGRFHSGDTICFPLEALPSQYTPPVVTDAEQQDIWDTDDEWTTNGFDSRKEWPRHVSPSKATINLNAPTIVNKSQNGIKYSRKSSHTKWTLEVEYPPMTADDFSLFHATAQAAQGQAVPFYFVLRNKDNTPILWADFMRDIDSDDVTQTFRYMDNYSSGDTVMMLDGFDSFETDAFRKGEVFIGSGNENGSLHTVINQVDANAYGEAKVRLAYPLRSGVSKAGSGYKDVYHAIVTLNSDDFMYQIDTDGYYRMSVSFDLDGWK